ncbi:MAG: hypothetical protein HC803_03300 [Saprospiraceae bacterium]|nr:hypothetical protein [Saprospiraceae bacterium]
MSQQNEHLQTLTEIRSLMERSSKFLSLSGLSGIAAGIVALVGAAIAYLYFDMDFFQINADYVRNGELNEVAYRTTYTKWGIKPIPFLLLDGFIVLTLALSLGFYFSIRKAKKRGYQFWDNTAKRLMINLSLPLIAGGIFALILLFKYDLIELIPAVTLIFYGLALLNGSKYTLDEVRYLGICEIALGLIVTWFVSFALLFWAIGFGVLHIVYGVLMYKKYDR